MTVVAQNDVPILYIRIILKVVVLYTDVCRL